MGISVCDVMFRLEHLFHQALYICALTSIAKQVKHLPSNTTQCNSNTH